MKICNNPLGLYSLFPSASFHNNYGTQTFSLQISPVYQKQKYKENKLSFLSV